MRALFLGAALAALSLPVQAQQPQCGPAQAVFAELESEHKETPVGQGLDDKRGVIVVITSTPDGSTWTALIVRPDGIACLAASGVDWSVAKAKPAGKGA
jgi:hypothetical protein